MDFTNVHFTLLKTRVAIGEKIWWIHPEIISDDGKVKMDTEQISRMEKHGNGPFILLEINKYEDRVMLHFKNNYGEHAEEDSKYFTI